MTKRCRDCKTELAADARGCPRCAMNFEAERKIERLFWLAILVFFLIMGVGLVGILRR